MYPVCVSTHVADKSTKPKCMIFMDVEKVCMYTLHVCMCMPLYIYVYTFIHTYIYIYTYIHTYIH